MRSRRPEKKSQNKKKQNSERTHSNEKKEHFQFVDRTGRVHGRVRRDSDLAGGGQSSFPGEETGPGHHLKKKHPIPVEEVLDLPDESRPGPGHHIQPRPAKRLGKHAERRPEKSFDNRHPIRDKKRPEKFKEKFKGKPKKFQDKFDEKFQGKRSKKFSKREEGGRKRYEDRQPKSRDRQGAPHPGARSKEKFRAAHGQAGPGGLKLKATVDKNHKGFGFLIFESRQFEDAFVPPREAEALFHGDRVEVTVSRSGEVAGIRVLEHRFRELVGRFSPHPMGTHRGGWVVYERKRAREEVWVPEPPAKALANEWVKAKLQFHESGPFPVTAEITEVYGEALPPSADIGMVAAEYNLIEQHGEAAESEAKALGAKVSEEDITERTDLRHVPLITIDGETARDFDDAVYVERSNDGFVLWVGIADVSHYVRPGTALDREARSRGTSVYFPEKAFHMLPRALSENLCSLKPNEPRLSMVARMEFDRQGKRGKTELFDAVIESRRRATYNQIQSEWEANKKDRNWEYAPHFELYAELRKMRANRGSIDFDLPEAELKVEPTGEVISIKMRERLDAHRLIEEFMIAANEAVTEWIMERNWPFVYRVHEEPATQALEKFQDLAATMGIRISLEGGNSPKVMADFVRRLEGHPAQTLLNMALLRSLKQAIYTADHGTHFGLASEAYTHFTSPIRRYPDLVVHRMLRWALKVELKKESRPKESELKLVERDLQEVCEHCSYRERLASDAERESIKLKQVRVMLRHLGDEFDGKIVGMLESGFFVQIPDPYVEGMVSRDTLGDDFYEFNEDRMIFYGRRSKRTFKMGDPVRVRAVRADLDRRQIDFALAED